VRQKEDFILCGCLIYEFHVMPPLSLHLLSWPFQQQSKIHSA
jgi:hypothetical protein